MKNEMEQGAAPISLSIEDQGVKKNVTKQSKMLGWLGIGLCGLACALPFIGVIAGVTFFAAIAVYLEMFAMLALGLGVVFFAYAYYQKNQKKNR